MGVQKQKKVRKELQFYKVNYHYDPPFSVLVDAEFIKVGLENKVYLKEEVPKFLQDKAFPATTGCVLNELRNKGDEYSGASLIAKRLQRVSCSHYVSKKKSNKFDKEDLQEMKPVSGSECILSIIEGKEGGPYVVAAQNDELRTKLRQIPGIPTIFFYRQTLVMEPISKASKDFVNQSVAKRIGMSEAEKDFLKDDLPSKKRKKIEVTTTTTTTTTDGDKKEEGQDSENVNSKEEDNEEAKAVKKKQKKEKNPNPLSVKKKKTKKTNPVTPKEGEQKKKRKRNRTKKGNVNESVEATQT